MLPAGGLLVARADSETCNVAATILGYYPNEGVNYFIAIVFGLCAISTVFFGIWKGTWGFSIAVGLGCILECAGYVSRVILHSNPCDSATFKLQVVTIIIGPTIICVGLYLTLKHIALAINPALSRIRPKLFPFIFVLADVSCLVVQAVGGIIAITAKTDSTDEHDIDLLRAGNRAIIAGICLQVIVLGAFGTVAVDYLLRTRRWFRGGQAAPEALSLWNNRTFKTFLYAISAAYGVILIRCIYRIAEMAGGWGNHIMQDQPSFVVLESFMILVGSSLLSAFPPGLFFPQMSGRSQAKQALDLSAKPEQSEIRTDSQAFQEDRRGRE